MAADRVQLGLNYGHALRQRGALLVVAGERGRRVAIPTFIFERVAWERRFDRTVGWAFAVGRAHTSDRALFCVTSLDGALADLGTRADLATVAG